MQKRTAQKQITQQPAAQEEKKKLNYDEILARMPDIYSRNNGRRMMDRDFIGFIEDLINQGVLEGAALGIAKLIVANRNQDAIAKLTEPQRYVYETYIIEEHVVTDDCWFCHSPINWEDQPFIEYRHLESEFLNPCHLACIPPGFDD